MPEKIQNITERTTAKGKPYFYVEFESGIEASAFNNQEVEYIRENLRSGDMCKAGIVQKGNYKNITSIEKIMDVNDDMPSQPDLNTPYQPIQQTLQRPKSKRGDTDVLIVRQVALKEACALVRTMMEVRGDDKGLGHEDVAILFQAFVNLILKEG